MYCQYAYHRPLILSPFHHVNPATPASAMTARPSGSWTIVRIHKVPTAGAWSVTTPHEPLLTSQMSREPERMEAERRRGLVSACEA